MSNELNEKKLAALCDLLVEKTMDLLKVMEQKSDPDRIEKLKNEVELIQSAIKAQKANGES